MGVKLRIPPHSQQGDNAYWSETVRALIDTGLTICFAVEGKLRLETVLRFLSNWLITKQSAPADEALLGRFAQLCRRLTECKDKAVVAKLEMARATLDMWGKLDPRTKSILTSFLVDVLAPLTATETARYLDVDRSPEFCAEELSLGKIMVFSLPAALNLEAAALLGKAIKSRLWSALQQRPTDRNQRLCAVVSDEYHYLACGDPGRSSDVTALATLRSRSVAVVVATQSLDHLASVMGPANFRALLPNFGTHFFFRTSEAYAGALASNIMGNREVPAEELEQTALLVADPWTPVTNELVCPPGALAQLQPCQAYVSIAGGNRRPECIWLGANHESAPERRQVPRRPSSDDALQELRAETWPETASASTPNDLSPPPDETQDEPLGFPSYSAPQLFYDETAWYRLLQYRRFQCSPT